MQLKLTLPLLFVCMAVLSCEEKKQAPNEYTNSPVSFEQPPKSEAKDTPALVIVPQQNLVEEQEKKQRLLEEDKERKLLDANQEISSFTNEVVQRVSPNSGKNGTYKITESEYDQLTTTLRVTFETSWDAYADFNPGSDYEKHVFTGRLVIYGNGEKRQEVVAYNDVLKRAIEANKAANEIQKWFEE